MAAAVRATVCEEDDTKTMIQKRIDEINFIVKYQKILSAFPWLAGSGPGASAVRVSNILRDELETEATHLRTIAPEVLASYSMNKLRAMNTRAVMMRVLDRLADEPKPEQQIGAMVTLILGPPLTERLRELDAMLDTKELQTKLDSAAKHVNQKHKQKLKEICDTNSYVVDAVANWVLPPVDEVDEAS